MNSAESAFRKNLIVVMVVHGLLIVALVFAEGFAATRQRSGPSPVDLVTPADILGDLPVGPGHGKGAYTPPSEPTISDSSPSPSDSVFTPEERPAPVKAKPLPAVSSSPGEIKIPKKVAKTSPKPTDKPAAVPAVSAGDIRSRFAKALAAGAGSSGGTPYGDNKPAGGGSGKSRVIGSPDGSPNGLIGGQGKGSPFWSYYLRVRDRMYEAWEQPGQALNWDRKLMTGILLRVARDGTVLNVSLKDPSGNRLMDDTALAAARKVGQLDPLPEGLGGTTADITVFFQLEG